MPVCRRRSASSARAGNGRRPPQRRRRRCGRPRTRRARPRSSSMHPRCPRGARRPTRRAIRLRERRRRSAPRSRPPEPPPRRWHARAAPATSHMDGITATSQTPTTVRSASRGPASPRASGDHHRAFFCALFADKPAWAATITANEAAREPANRSAGAIARDTSNTESTPNPPATTSARPSHFGSLARRQRASTKDSREREDMEPGEVQRSR